MQPLLEEENSLGGRYLKTVTIVPSDGDTCRFSNTLLDGENCIFGKGQLIIDKRGHLFSS